MARILDFSDGFESSVEPTAIAITASSIVNTPSGNLSATTVQGALNELQTDVDTRVTSATLTSHTSATVAHGATGAVVGTTNTQTLTNKTLTAPAITSPTGIVKADVGLSNVDNTSDATKNAATATLTNKTISGASNTLSNIPLTSAVTGTLPLANGGTGQTTKAAAFDALSPMTTGGDLIYGGASGTATRLANGTAGYVLSSNGTTLAPTWIPYTAFTAPRSEVYVDTGNGQGSTNTPVRRFANTRKNVGSAITIADSAANGATFTINENGVYAISYGDYSTGVFYFGLTVNCSALTTAMNSQTHATGKRAGANTPGAFTQAMVSWTGYLAAGDVVRAMNSNAGIDGDAFVWISITQVSK